MKKNVTKNKQTNKKNWYMITLYLNYEESLESKQVKFGQKRVQIKIFLYLTIVSTYEWL